MSPRPSAAEPTVPMLTIAEASVTTFPADMTAHPALGGLPQVGTEVFGRCTRLGSGDTTIASARPSGIPIGRLLSGEGDRGGATMGGAFLFGEVTEP